MDGTDDETLIRRWQQDGDEQARDILLRRHHPLLRAEAYRATRGGFDYDDAYQLAALGFLHALDKYDPSFGASLKTYARRWIRQRLHHGRQHLGPVYRPAHVVDATTRIKKERRRMHMKGLVPTAEALSARTGTTVENVEAFLAAAQTAVPLDAPIGEDGGATYINLLADGRPTPEDMVEQTQRRQLLAEAIEALPPKQAEAARLYYLDNLTLEEIGAQRGTTRQGVHLLVQKAERRLVERLAG